MTSELTAPRHQQPIANHPPAWQWPFRFVGSVLAKVYVEPVREDRVRMINWPKGLPLLAIIATAGYAAAMIIAAATPILRSRLAMVQIEPSTQPVGIPAALPWIMIMLMAVAAVILQTGALHAPRWLRIVSLFGSLSLILTISGPPSSSVDLIIPVSFWGVLVIFQIIRWGGVFRWWEYAAVAVCFGVPIVVSASSLANQSTEGATPADWLADMVPNVGSLVAPLLLAAGYAIAEWAFNSVVWAVDLGRQRLPRWVLMAALILLLGWRVVAEVLKFRNEVLTPTVLLAPLGLLAAGSVVWFGLDKIADRAQPGTTRLGHLGEDLRSVALPVAFLFTASTVVEGVLGYPTLTLSFYAKRLQTIYSGEEAVSAFLEGRYFALLAFVALLAWSVWLALRARRGRAELVGLMALFFLAAGLSSASLSVELIGFWSLGGVLVVFFVLLFTGRLSGNRVEGMLLVAGLAAVLSSRSFFADPIESIFGGSAALLVGLIWQFLTGGRDANGDSRGFPRPSRVLLVLGFNLLAMVVLAYYRLVLAADDPLDLYQTGGDQVLGSALLLAALISSVSAVIHGDSPAETVGAE